MSTTITTTPVDVEDEYTLLLRSRLGDEQTMNRVSESFENVFRQENIRSQTLSDIRQLRQTVNDIDRGFQMIRNDLWTFDQQGFRDENGQVLQLAPQWTAHYDRFKQIMEQSYRNAVDASAFMEQYCTLLPSPGEHINVNDIPDMKMELELFMLELKAKEEVAYGTQSSFKTLAEEVRLFACILENSVQRAGVQLTRELNETRARLSDLQRRLQEYIRRRGSVCADAVSLGAGYAFDALTYLCPAFAILSLVSLEKEINQCRHDLNVLEGKQPLLKKYQQLLDATKDEIGTLANKIDVIANIWQYLKSDMQSLHEKLRLALTTGTKPRSLGKKLQIAREVYLRLAELLEEYAKGRP
ncbi:uncharacterized protein TRAVEDRAFT_40814 [Trametes versicolor FP-101664 SS1]|uniref:Uncharacterized protein n=1 Tax=Trametes versicolor (strain FP-101664) TaxID=717944 RepID=R7S8Z9_TRAVS|nr:uncharacterized protein TRAVEDRAFT_40814 [Trametes versicolor FP-101664 SS1]EIW52117.1 hypothetical protein TRAVEDRAFT_40814 [Trametes versicolor FP-101664 SS1]